MKISNQILDQKDLIIGNSIEKNNKKTISNIYSDLFESILGAIYIDGGIENAKKFINNHVLTNLDKSKKINRNYKGMLVEKCHSLKYSQPVFKLINDVSKSNVDFEVELIVNDISYRGFGNTKKNAEIDASRAALKKI